MSGISSSVGLFSGIDTQSLISQLLAVESRPKTVIQRRVAQLQSQQAAYLDLNSRLSALKSAAQKFRIGRVFDSARAVSSPNRLWASWRNCSLLCRSASAERARKVSLRRPASAAYRRAASHWPSSQPRRRPRTRANRARSQVVVGISGAPRRSRRHSRPGPSPE